MQKDPDEQVRRIAMSSLDDLIQQYPEIEAAYINALADSEGGQLHASLRLGDVLADNAELKGKLLSALKHEDRNMRFGFMLVLNKHVDEDPDIQDAYLQLVMHDPDQSLRGYASSSLRSTVKSKPQLQNSLLEMFNTTDDENLRKTTLSFI